MSPKRKAQGEEAARSKRSRTDRGAKAGTKESEAARQREGGRPVTRGRRLRTLEKLEKFSEEPERLLRGVRKRPSPKPADDMADRPSAGAAGAQDDDDYSGQAHNALQGLLRRLGAGLEDVFPGAGGSSRVKSILVMLRDEDEMQQLAGLTELCEYLSISTEESLAMFPTEQAVPMLVNFLGYEHNPDLMLLAARALTFLADVSPPAASAIIRHGAVPAFCARLLSIEYIDLAEQSLQALEKLSHDHPGSLLRNGALVATGVQRVAVATAANICRGLTTDHEDAVATAAPILIGLLSYQDAKIVDSACLALTRIAQAYARSSTHLETLCNLGLISSIVDMVTVAENGSVTSQLQIPTFYGLIKLLATCAGGSHAVAEALLRSGISDTLRNLMRTSSLLTAAAASPGNALQNGAGEARAGADAAALPAKEQESCLRTQFLREHPELLIKFTADLLPLLVAVYSSSGTPAVKRQCLTAVAQMLHFNSSKTLAALLEGIPAAAFIASLLGAKDATTVACGMQARKGGMGAAVGAEQGSIMKYFLKEGVVHAVEQLAAAAQSATPQAAPGAAPAGESAPSGRRRSGAGRPASRSADREVGGQEAAGASVRTPASNTLRAAVGTRAARFKARHFTDAQGNVLGCDTEGVKLLTDACGRLGEGPAAVGALLVALAASGNAAVSTFELLSSGAVAALRVHLQGEDLPEGPARAQRLLERLAAFSRVALAEGSGGAPPLVVLVAKLLAALAASEKFVVQLNPVGPVPNAMAAMLGYGYRGTGLQHSGASSSLSAGLAALSNPLKIRLSRAGDEGALRDYSANQVLIEPLASMSQIEDFLWPRVNTGSSAAATPAAAAAGDDLRSREARRASGRAASGPPEASVNAGAALAATGAAPGGGLPGGGARRGAAPPSQNRPIPSRRLTRAQARAAAEAEIAGQGMEDAAAVAAEMEAAAAHARAPAGAGEGDATSEEAEELLMDSRQEEEEHDEGDEDEDMEEGYVEGEDEDYEDEGEGLALSVHDMHLAEPDAEAAAAQQQQQQQQHRHAGAGGSQQQQERQQQTYAQATGSRGASAGGAGEAAPRLAFYMGGRLLQPASTIFQAVQQAMGAGGGDMGSRLWGEVHTLSYRLWGSAMRLAENEAAASTMAPPRARTGADAEPMDVESPRAAGVPADAAASPLGELLRVGELPVELGASPDTLALLSVLRSLEALNRLAPHLWAWLEARGGAARPPGAPLPGYLNRDAFVSSKLATKLGQQLKDVLSICGGALPSWCHQLVGAARFLFPFETRRRFFYCTSFGLARALHYLQQMHAAEHGPGSAADRDAAGLRIGRVQRQKVRISRRKLLESAHKVFELYAGAKSLLEIEFFNEVGTGLGPTLEFYTLLSHELQCKSLGMWRHDDPAGAGASLVDEAKQAAAAAAARALNRTTSAGPGPLQARAAAHHPPCASAACHAVPCRALPRCVVLDELVVDASHSDGVHSSELVVAPLGLFPAPLAPAQRRGGSPIVQHFGLLGRTVAKALQDGRMLDMALSPVFYRLALGRRVDLHDIRRFDPALGASLEKLAGAAAAHEAAGRVGPLLVDGCPLEDLCLSFELPGYPAYPLRGGEGGGAGAFGGARRRSSAGGGASRGGGAGTAPAAVALDVTAANLREYIDAVVDAVLGSGVAAQVAAFREGFNAIFPLSTLSSFYEDEIEAILCGTGETWTVERLAEVIKFDHGYTSQARLCLHAARITPACPACCTVVRHFLEVLAELDAVDQRRFLRFVTGCPRLPPGGLAALQPRLTVVRKLSAAAMAAAAAGGEGGGGGASAPIAASLSLPSLSAGGGSSAPGGGVRSLADGDLPSASRRPSGGVRFGESYCPAHPSVCVCVDASLASKQAAQWATTFLRPGQCLRLLTVVQPSASAQMLYSGTAPGLPTDAACEGDPADLARARTLLEERREDVAEMGVDPGRVSCTPVVSCLGTASDIGRRLLDEAEGCGCGILVVGSRGLGVPERAVLGMLGMGSIGDYLVRNARIECVAVHRPVATGESLTEVCSLTPAPGSTGARQIGVSNTTGCVAGGRQLASGFDCAYLRSAWAAYQLARTNASTCDGVGVSLGQPGDLCSGHPAAQPWATVYGAWDALAGTCAFPRGSGAEPRSANNTLVCGTAALPPLSADESPVVYANVLKGERNVTGCAPACARAGLAPLPNGTNICAHDGSLGHVSSDDHLGAYCVVGDVGTPLDAAACGCLRAGADPARLTWRASPTADCGDALAPATDPPVCGTYINATAVGDAPTGWIAAATWSARGEAYCNLFAPSPQPKGYVFSVLCAAPE
eukprot:scaffold12.g8099.t1